MGDDRHGLDARTRAVLTAEGVGYAERGVQNWQGLLEHMRDDYPRYVDAFLALEAMGPDEDRDALERMTAHEVAIIAFVGLELAGDPASTRPLLDFIATIAAPAAL